MKEEVRLFTQVTLHEEDLTMGLDSRTGFKSVFCLHRRKFSAATNGTCEEEQTEKVGAWDFVEPSQRSYCNCSRSVTFHIQYVQVLLICAHFKEIRQSLCSFEGHSQQYICKLYSHYTLTSLLFFMFFNLSLFCVSDSSACAQTSVEPCVSVSRTFLFPHWWESFVGEKNSLTTDGALQG